MQFQLSQVIPVSDTAFSKVRGRFTVVQLEPLQVKYEGQYYYAFQGKRLELTNDKIYTMSSEELSRFIHPYKKEQTRGFFSASSENTLEMLQNLKFDYNLKPAGKIISGRSRRQLYRLEKFNTEWDSPGLYFAHNLTEFCCFQYGNILLEYTVENYYDYKPGGIAQIRRFDRAYWVNFYKVCLGLGIQNDVYADTLNSLGIPTKSYELLKYMGYDFEDLFNARSANKEYHVAQNEVVEAAIRANMVPLELKNQDELEIA